MKYNLQIDKYQRVSQAIDGIWLFLITPDLNSTVFLCFLDKIVSKELFVSEWEATPFLLHSES